MEKHSTTTTFGENIRRLREFLGLSQQQLAIKAGGGITRQQVANLESGRAEPTVKNLPFICRAVGFHNPLRLLEEPVMVHISGRELQRLGFEGPFPCMASWGKTVHYIMKKQQTTYAVQFVGCMNSLLGGYTEYWEITIDGREQPTAFQLEYIHQIKDHFAAWAGYDLPK